MKSDTSTATPNCQAPNEQPGELIAPEAQARQHSYVRKAHETELTEDYVELIADLIASKGEARPVELAQRMGVVQATVTKMVERLRQLGLIRKEPYRAIFLTAAGARMARASRERHLVVLRFLKALGVSETNARLDAEGVEHHVCAETIECMRAFVAARQASEANTV